MLLCRGFTCTIDKVTHDRTYWKCEYVRTVKWQGRIHTNYINTIILYDNVNHNDSENAVSNIRDRAVNFNGSA